MRLPRIAVFVALFAACAPAMSPEAPSPAQPPTETAGEAPQATPAVTLMTFNVENLFDTRDDPGKDDATYLPLAMKASDEHRAACARVSNPRWRDECLHWDWNEAIVARKLAVVGDAILQVGNGRGPDIVALQEVENLAILERLVTERLAGRGYTPVLIEGDDERGIDVAFLTRLPLAAPAVLHRIEFEGVDDASEADTRGILEATFRLPDGSLLSGFAVHFPAPFHPPSMRRDAYAALNALAAALPDDRPAFAAGDFNTTSEEDRERHMLERFARPGWTVVHETGCGACKGTSYYPPTDSWSFLDMLLWRPAEERGDGTTWRLRPGSVAIANQTPAQVTPDGTPARFALPAGTGVSDHWPLVAVIEPAGKQRIAF
ncbi:MAG TPA: endonuclease/exonuclease/phosphatase family protein [Woeseiaceae bacterium]